MPNFEYTDAKDINYYVRYVREAKVSAKLEGFQAVLGAAALQVFGDKAAVLKKRIPNRELGDTRRKLGNRAAIGVPAVKIYPPERLRAVQFEALVPVSELTKLPMLKRLDNSSEDIINSVPLTDQELMVSTRRFGLKSCIDYRKQAGYPRLGEEILLPLVGGSDFVTLDEQNKSLEYQVLSKGAGNDLRDNFQPVELIIAVGRLPNFRPEELSEYEDKKQELTRLVTPYLPLLGVELCPVTIDHQLRTRFQ